MKEQNYAQTWFAPFTLLESDLPYAALKEGPIAFTAAETGGEVGIMSSGEFQASEAAWQKAVPLLKSFFSVAPPAP